MAARCRTRRRATRRAAAPISGVLAAALCVVLAGSAAAAPAAPAVPIPPAAPAPVAEPAVPPATVAAAAPGPAAAPAPVAPVTALPPAPLPPAPATPTSIDPVAFTPGARDASGVREARSTRPLKLVAVTWTGSGPDAVDVRSTDAAGRWGAWTALDPAGSERDDQPARAPHGGTDPIWVGDRTAVEVRATRGGVPVLDGLSVVRIDPGTSPNDAAIARSGRGGVAAPSYVTRAQWGADEKSMTWPPRTTPALKAVTIHHTAESNDYAPGDSAAIVRGIYAYHARTQGWGDIGYNALVDKFGTIFEGRAGGMDRTVTAAHAGGFNRGTWGIAMMGNLSSTPPTAAEFESVAKLAAWKLGGTYGDPEQEVSLTSAGGGTAKFPRGESATVHALFAHRDVGNTACPGDAAYGAMDALRASVRAIIAAAAPDVRRAWTASRTALGEPTRVESPTADGRGRFTDFEHGSVYWSAPTGAWEVTGAIRDRWRAQGGERSPLGMPTGGEYAVPGGRQQNFEHGALRFDVASGAAVPPT